MLHLRCSGGAGQDGPPPHGGGQDGFPSPCLNYCGSRVWISLQKLFCKGSPPPAVTHQSLVFVCVLGSGGVSASVLFTPQGVKDFRTNRSSLKNKLFNFSLLTLFLGPKPKYTEV